MTEIYQDDILHVSADLADMALERLGLKPEDWEKIYLTMIDKLNEILDNPDFEVTDEFGE